MVEQTQFDESRFDRMQTPEWRRATQVVFDTPPEEFGKGHKDQQEEQGE